MGLTAEESYRLHGTLSDQHIRDLLDGAHYAECAMDAEAYIEEAKGCFPAEDFLQEVKELALELKANTRGANRENAERLCTALDELETRTFQQSEYGADELKKALEALAGKES